MSSSTDAVEESRERGTAVTLFTPGRFDGKVAIVTGAGSGIGRATALRLAAEGASVACLDIVDDALASVVREIDSSGAGRAIGLRCDVTDEQSVAAAVAGAGELGRPSVVCNVAGIGSFARTETSTLDHWNRTIAVNLTGTYLVCRAALPILLEHGGCITNVSSTAGLIGQPYSAAYCASKGGVSLLTKALAVEYMGRGVRVNAVAPGGVETPIIGGFMPPADGDMKLIERIMTPMGFTTPAAMAGALAWLSSDEAAYTTGAILSVDGGVTA